MGGRSLRTSLGSSGVRIANCHKHLPRIYMNRQGERQRTSFTTLIRTQLLLLPVKMPKRSGAKGKYAFPPCLLASSMTTPTAAPTTPRSSSSNLSRNLENPSRSPSGYASQHGRRQRTARFRIRGEEWVSKWSRSGWRVFASDGERERR